MTILALLTVLIWCFVEHRWTAEAWQTPVEYTEDPGAGDAVLLFAAFKSAADGCYVPFESKMNPFLGAPFVANWNDFPNNEQFQIFLGGLLAEGIGVFAAGNLACLAGYVFAAVAFYFVCRQSRCAWPWAFAGALVFAFSPFAFGQGQHHLSNSAYWNIPLCLLVGRWVSVHGGLGWRGWRWWFAVGVALLAGIQNVYYAVMFVQLLGLGCALQLMRRNYRAIFSAMAVGGITFATFMVMNVNMFIYHHQYGPNKSAVTRHYEEIEWTAMKFVDFFMPFQHRWQAFADWAGRYFANNYVHGEFPPSNYLGIVGIAALAWFACRVFRRIVLSRPARPLPLEALQFAWIFIFATVGGVNGLLGTLGFVLLRATARYTIFLLSIVLLFLMRRLSLLTVKSPVLAMALPVALVAVAFWDQLPKIKTDADIQTNAALVASDRTFTEAMEKRLPEGAMVFQMPIMDYPENPSKILNSYEHFRPYIYSQTLRFSFGNDKGRPSADWQHQLWGVSLPDTVTILERYGFSAIYVNLVGFDDMGSGVMADLQRLGLTDMLLSPKRDLLCVFLKPNPNPVLPKLTR